MSENGNNSVPPEMGIEALPLVEILITYNPADGEVKVKGPVNSRVLFLGVLEIAKQACLINVDKQTQSSGLALVGQLPAFLQHRGRRG